MESHHFESPISTLKVDFGCSKDCPGDLKNLLQQLKGVKSISIDPNQGKVTVVGNVNPIMLIKLLQKMGKRAQLWSFDKAPMQTRAGSYPKHKQTSHCCCESDSEDDDSDEDSISSEHTQHRAPNGQRSSKRHGCEDWFGFGNRMVAPTVTGYHPPMPWYQPVAYARPSMHARPVPWYGYFGQSQPLSPTHRQFSSKLLPPYNPMTRYTSYADNYRYTV